MSSTNEFYEDRRKRTRFQVQQGAYAAIGPHYIRLGPITNISLGGVGFHYFVDRDQSTSIRGLNLTLRNKKHSISQVPFKIICDMEINTEGAYYLKMMYCGLKFGPLTFDQFKQLDDFIIYNTVDIVSDRRSVVKRRSKRITRKISGPSNAYYQIPEGDDRRMIFDRRNYSLMKPFK